ncbi:hypothetical protein NYR55_11850 [Sphingomonas sp. BGYR3]|uniref:hypothetical protein n=1 Tax=Sphingomonas sp. BGYR3 TaxID=2975483 RepID=UPI0021A9334E|nr:hypothetical protein [Sphingomonas sp. BGYR3]MDG5489308.1 hypothetical protein [Sphingomonas sp. BGYR3]
MLKTIMLAGAALIATPAIAQDMQQAPADPAAGAAQTAPAPEQTAPEQAAPAQGQPATTADQVAQVIDADWAKYDVDGNSELSKEEFGTWLGTLRKASEPGADLASTEMQGWMGQAFAAADADKSSTVSKPELTKFLSQSA